MQENNPLDILILEEDKATLDRIRLGIPPHLLCRNVSTIEEAEEILNRNPVRVLLCADDLSEETGLMFLARTRDLWPELRRILMAPNLDYDLFFHAMNKVRLFSYLNKPIDESHLKRSIHQALKSPMLEISHEITPLNKEVMESPPAWVRTLGGLTMVILCIASTIAVMILLYELKSYLGIDFFPDWHLGEAIK